MRAVQTEAESDAQQSAYRGEQSGKQAALERECWDIRDGKRDGLSAHKGRYKIRDERGHDAREQTCIVNDPTLITPSAKTAAVIGVPKSAENTALMPHIVMICISFSSRRDILPISPAMLPPS